MAGDPLNRAWRRIADDPLPFVVVLIVVLAAVLTVVTVDVGGSALSRSHSTANSGSSIASAMVQSRSSA